MHKIINCSVIYNSKNWKHSSCNVSGCDAHCGLVINTGWNISQLTFVWLAVWCTKLHPLPSLLPNLTLTKELSTTMPRLIPYHGAPFRDLAKPDCSASLQGSMRLTLPCIYISNPPPPPQIDWKVHKGGEVSMPWLLMATTIDCSPSMFTSVLK